MYIVAHRLLSVNTGPTSTLRSTTSSASEDSTLRRGNLEYIAQTCRLVNNTLHLTTSFVRVPSAASSNGVAAFLTLDKAPVAGAPIRFSVKVINTQRVIKVMKVHMNAQVKEYNHSPSDTFWEAHGLTQLAPMEGSVTFLSSAHSGFLL